ncbi:MAG TPA: CoA ester lyase, partial [Pseudonocardiaceae bacterium]
MTAHRGRSWLFVPGDRPERFDKALHSGADAVIVDLEDAVAPANKARARDAVADLLDTQPVYVRVNGADTRWHTEDLAALSHRAGLLGVLLPKTTSAADVAATAAALGAHVQLVALIETAAGLRNADTIAAAERTTRLAFGSIDFALDIGADTDDAALLYARSTLVLASRVAGLPGPVDGVTTDLDDSAATTRDAEHARGLGFAGKLCIHPRQVGPVNTAFGYST